MNDKLTNLILIVFTICAILYLCIPNHNKWVKVVQVIDGDTFVSSDGRHIRLADIDAPETGQFYGDSSTIFLESMIKGKPVDLQYVNTDKYDRDVCYIYLKDGASSVNRAMVSSGYAYCGMHIHSPIDMIEAEDWAQGNKLGLWKYSNLTLPYIYRKQHQYETNK